MVKKGKKTNQKRIAKLQQRGKQRKDGPKGAKARARMPGAALQREIAPPDLTRQKARLSARVDKMHERQAQQRRAVLDSKRRGIVASAGQHRTGANFSNAISSAAARSAAYERSSAAESASAGAAGSAAGDEAYMKAAVHENSRKTYMKELRKVVENADVILEVLDARDPMGCRCADIEDSIASNPGKKLVLVINKIDLVPHDVLEGWVRYLRKEHPTLPFKASTQEGSSNLSAAPQGSKTAPQSFGSKAMGTEALMSLLKNYTRSGNSNPDASGDGKSKGKGSAKMKLGISVGVIGYPNVGKSSVINSLKRTRAVGVSATPGHTRSMQEVVLDRKIRLLDSPGVVFDDGDTASIILRNCINAEALTDPVPAVEAMLKHCDPAHLVQFYSIPPFDDVIKFLGHMARKRGKLGPGGITDRKASARAVLQDWNSGKIPFWTDPPSVSAAASRQTGAEIVTNFSGEFDPFASDAPLAVLSAETVEHEAKQQALEKKEAAVAAGREVSDAEDDCMDDKSDDGIQEDVEDDVEVISRSHAPRAGDGTGTGVSRSTMDAPASTSSSAWASAPVPVPARAAASVDDDSGGAGLVDDDGDDPYASTGAQMVQARRATEKKRRRQKRADRAQAAATMDMDDSDSGMPQEIVQVANQGWLDSDDDL